MPGAVTDLPFSSYREQGLALLGKPASGDGSSRHGYGVRVYAECGSICAYCRRQLAEPYENWLDLSVDHVIPVGAIKQLDYPREWVEDLMNLVTACRACNEFLNGYRVSDPVPVDLGGFCALRDRHFVAKRVWVLDRHARERARYERWYEATRGAVASG